MIDTPLLSLSLFSTPLPIYLVFIYLFYQGFKTMNARPASLLRIWLIEGTLVSTTVQNFIFYNNSSLFYSLAWIPGVIAGIMVARTQQLSIEPLSKKIVLPGSSGPLIYFFILFILKICANSLQASYPLIYQNSLAAIVIIAGVLIGFFCGFLFYYVYYYFSNRNKPTSYWGNK